MIRSSSRFSTTGDLPRFIRLPALCITLLTLGIMASPFKTDAADPGLEPVQIDTIIVEGNRVTQRFVILAEMEHGKGSWADSESLERDRNRLESIGLFSRAQLSLDTLTTGQNVLRVKVTELWYIWPSVFLALDEDNPSRFGFGALISDGNFRGRRETVDLSIRFGYIEGQQFSWNIPYLNRRSGDLSMTVRLKSVREHEPRSLREWEDVDAIERMLDVKLGKRFNLENSVWTQFNITQVRFDALDNRPLDLTESDGPQGDINGGLGVGFIRDTRLYKPWASQGYSFQLQLGSSLGLNYNGGAFLRPGISLARFVSPHPQLHLAGMTETQWIVGSSLRYRRLLLDRDNGVRSPMEQGYEGTWRSLVIFELRGDFLPIRYVTLEPVFDFLRPYSRDLKFGLSGVLFVDGGVVGGTPSTQSSSYIDQKTDGWEVAYGAGLVVHVPYRDIVRIEYSRSYRFPEEGYRLLVRIGPSF